MNLTEKKQKTLLRLIDGRQTTLVNMFPMQALYKF